MIHPFRVAVAALGVTCCNNSITVLAISVHYLPPLLLRLCCLTAWFAVSAMMKRGKTTSSKNAIMLYSLRVVVGYQAALGLVRALAAASSG